MPVQPSCSPWQEGHSRQGGVLFLIQEMSILPLSSCSQEFHLLGFLPKQHFSQFSSQDVDGFFFLCSQGSLLGYFPLHEGLGLPFPRAGSSLPAPSFMGRWGQRTRPQCGPSALFTSAQFSRCSLGIDSELGLEHMAMEISAI